MALALLIAQQLLFIGALALVGQAAVAVFNWQRRHQNPVYQLFRMSTRPVLKLVRRLTPRIVLDQHVPIVALLLLLFAYLGLGLLHRDVCDADLLQAGCKRWAEARSRA